MTNISSTIRMLALKESDCIADLWNEQKAYHLSRTKNFQDYYQQLSFKQRQQEMSGKDNVAIFLAEHLGQKVGYCIASIHQSNGEIDSLYVKADHRKLRLGKRLVKEALQWLENGNARPIRLLVGEGNEEVIAFYEKLGFKTNAVMMQKL